MFLEKIDWNDPRFSKWNLSHLEPMNEAQRDAFFDDDEIDFPEFSEAELKELSLKVPCRVELFHSNVCLSMERCWPSQTFRNAKFCDLLPHQKRILNRTMVRDATKLHNEYVNENQLKKRLNRRKSRALAPYYEERYLRNRFNRIKGLGDSAHVSSTDSEVSLETVINTADFDNESSTVTSTDGQDGSRADSNDFENQIKNRIRYEYSSDDDEDVVSVELSEDEINQQKKILSTLKNKMSNIIDVDAFTSLNPAIDKLRQLSTNFLNSRNVDGGGDIDMILEISNETNIRIVSDEMMSDDEDGILIIDERFNQVLSESTVSSSHVRDNDDDDNDVESIQCLTPIINSSEFVLINSLDINQLRQSFDESLDLFLNPINQIHTSIQEQIMRQK